MMVCSYPRQVILKVSFDSPGSKLFPVSGFRFTSWDDYFPTGIVIVSALGLLFDCMDGETSRRISVVSWFEYVSSATMIYRSNLEVPRSISTAFACISPRSRTSTQRCTRFGVRLSALPLRNSHIPALELLEISRDWLLVIDPNTIGGQRTATLNGGSNSCTNSSAAFSATS